MHELMSNYATTARGIDDRRARRRCNLFLG